MFQVVVQETPTVKSCVLGAVSKIIQIKIYVLQVKHFTGAAWQQVKHSTVVNCFHQCGHMHKLNTEANSDPSNEAEDDASHRNYLHLGDQKAVTSVPICLHTMSFLPLA